MTANVVIHQGDALEVLQTLPEQSVQCCVTSPPYWCLRDYGVAGQLGSEPTPEEYVAKMVEVFREVRRVLRDDGTLWLNLGDTYIGGGRGGNWKPSMQGPHANSSVGVKSPRCFATGNLIGIPWRVALALQADGWILRQDIIWHKPCPMPESVTNRCTKAHEYLFLLVKRMGYYCDMEAIKIDSIPSVRYRDSESRSCLRAKANGRNPSGNEKPGSVFQTDNKANKRSVWTIASQGFAEAHFATFPPKLVEPCILAGTPTDRESIVLDPFLGSGTTALVARRLGRSALGIELNPDYVAMAKRRLQEDNPLFSQIEIRSTERIET
jgi:DNA modification methylase